MYIVSLQVVEALLECATFHLVKCKFLPLPTKNKAKHQPQLPLKSFKCNLLQYGLPEEKRDELEAQTESIFDSLPSSHQPL